MPKGPSDQRVQTVCLMILAGIAMAAAMHFLRAVLVPFVLAVFLTYAIAPLVILQCRRLRFPRGLAIATTLALGVIVLSAVWSIVSVSVSQMSANAPEYQAQLNSTLQKVATALPLERFGLEPESMENPLGITRDSLGRVVTGGVNAVIDIFSQGIIVMIFVLFLLLGGCGMATDGSPLLMDIEGRVQRYIQTKVFVSAITGTLVAATLGILGIDLAIAFGIFAFLLNFIPNLGSFVATVLPLPIVLVTPDITLVTGILAIAIPGAIQFAVGNVIEPKMMGRSLDLHPVTILLALIFWGTLWGVVGMFLAVPITAVLRILLGRLEVTRPFAALLEGRFAAE